MHKFSKSGKNICKRIFRRFSIITGSSETSWKDAIVKAIEEASKTIDYLSSVKVLEQKAKINGNKISEYFVDLDLTFLIDLNRKGDN